MSTGHHDPNDGGFRHAPGRDQVTLSAHERESLAHLEQRLRADDPDFASRLRGYSWRWLLDLFERGSPLRLPGWAGPVLLIVGLAATLWVVGTAAWLSVVTLALTVAGGLRVGETLRVYVADRKASPSSDPDAVR